MSDIERDGRLTLAVRSSQQINVGEVERHASVVIGGALVALGLKKINPWAVAVAAFGGALIYRGMTGHCSLYNAMDIDTAAPPEDNLVVVKHGIKVQKSVTIDKTPEELYYFWRNFENLPQFMKHLKKVRKFDDKRSHWTARAPVGTTVEWDAEIINEIDGKLIAWKSTDNADVSNVGSVHFDSAPVGRGAVVTVVLQYDPPAGKLGVSLAKLFGEEPSIQVEEDLQRFKQLMEASEFSTTEG